MKIIGEGGHAKVIKSMLKGVEQNATIIAIGNNKDRKKVAVLEPGPFFVLMHKTAFVAEGVKLGEGTVVMAGAIIQPGVMIGKHCIINTGATLDHDCLIGDYVHIGPGANLCGDVTVMEGAQIGVGVGVAQGAVIHAWTLCKAARLDMVPL